MKKILAMILVVLLVGTMLTGCGNKEFDSAKDITVVSREDGSGTRGAFIELFGIEEKDAAGNKVDKTTLDAQITNYTSVMMSTVEGNQYAIGYISMGSLNDTVKALKVDGVEASVENIKDGSYKIARPFNIATKGNESEATLDFINFILSDDGAKIIEENGYISVENGAFSSNNASGKVVVAGSSSVTPVMEKLKEAYTVINPNATIEIQQSDSTTGMTSLADGICDIGMASRELKDTELAKGLNAKVIAMDGICVVVNKDNTLEDISQETVKAIFTGSITSWSEVIK